MLLFPPDSQAVCGLLPRALMMLVALQLLKLPRLQRDHRQLVSHASAPPTLLSCSSGRLSLPHHTLLPKASPGTLENDMTRENATIAPACREESSPRHMTAATRSKAPKMMRAMVSLCLSASVPTQR